MKLVLDNNILFSIMNPKSVSATLFSSINVNFIAPEFIKLEFKKHKEICLIKSKLSKQEFELRQKQIEQSIEFFDESKYEKYLKIAKDLISDPDDIDFIALALLTNSSIWSNDKHLKEQSAVKVFSTKEIIELLF